MRISHTLILVEKLPTNIYSNPFRAPPPATKVRNETRWAGKLRRERFSLVHRHRHRIVRPGSVAAPSDKVLSGVRRRGHGNELSAIVSARARRVVGIPGTIRRHRQRELSAPQRLNHDGYASISVSHYEQQHPGVITSP